MIQRYQCFILSLSVKGVLIMVPLIFCVSLLSCNHSIRVIQTLISFVFSLQKGVVESVVNKVSTPHNDSNLPVKGVELGVATIGSCFL